MKEARNRVLVLGAGGFLGAHVVRSLVEQGFPVTAGARRASDGLFESRQVTFDCGDLTDLDYVRRAVRDQQAIIFCAGRTWEMGLPLDQYVQGNVDITRIFFEALDDRRDVRVIYTSSIVTLGGTIAPVTFDEQTGGELRCESRQGPYDRAKIEAEQIALAHAERGMDVVVLNPGQMLGPGAAAEAKLAAADFILNVCLGTTPLFIESRITFCDVRDVARAHVAALSLGESGQRYILGGEILDRSEFYALLSRLAATRTPRQISWRLLYGLFALLDALSAYTGGLVKSPVNRRFACASSLHYCGDSSKARRAFGYESRPLETTVFDTLMDDWRRKLLPDRFRFLDRLSPDNALTVLVLRQLLDEHCRHGMLAPQFCELYDICRLNQDVHRLLTKVVETAQFDDRRGRFVFDRRVCRDELRLLDSFFEYVYFSSDEFLSQVL